MHARYIYIRAIEKTTPVACIYKSKWIDKLIYIYILLASVDFVKY